MRMTRVTPARRTYVEVSYLHGGGRFEAELSFGASDKRRALEHRSAAVTLATLYGVEWRTPWALTPSWTLYRELSEGAEFGRPDERRMIVSGPARSVARYLVALPRVLAGLEAAATRAARRFGQWRRSLIAVLSGHLEYEDPSTLRVRAREFRTAVLGHLAGYLRTPPVPAASDPARPMWEQAAAVAAEVWADHPVDPWDAPKDEVAAVLSAGQYTEPSVLEPAPAAHRPQEPAEEGSAAHEGEALAVEDDEDQDQDEPTAEARAVPAVADHTPQVTSLPKTSREPHGSRRGNPRSVRRRCFYGSISTRARPRYRPAPSASPPRTTRRTARRAGHRPPHVSHERGTRA